MRKCAHRLTSIFFCCIICSEGLKNVINVSLTDTNDIENKDKLKKGGTMNLLKKPLKKLGQFLSDRKYKRFYDAFFALADKSKTHATFSKRIYGKDLCQHGMMDMAQLTKLLEVLNLQENNRVLELGCGNGFITEYISDVTGAHITGVDYSKTAIKNAVERTKDKKEKLSFLCQDIKKMDFSAGTFDAVIVIDTLHFVDNIDKMVKKMKNSLKPNGQMGIFFTQRIFSDDLKDWLQPDNTQLAQSLKKYNLNFKTWDFTKEEAEQWRKKLQVLEELKPEFEAEGNLLLFKLRYNEANFIAPNEHRRSRFLYHVLAM